MSRSLASIGLLFCLGCPPESCPDSDASTIELPSGTFENLQTNKLDTTIVTVKSVSFTEDTVIVRLAGADGRIWKATYSIGRSWEQ